MRLGWKLMSRSFTAPAEGARTLVYAISAAEAGTVSGTYFANCRPARISRQAADDTLAGALWQKSEQMVDSSA
jgi:hypothetical protein